MPRPAGGGRAGVDGHDLVALADDLGEGRHGEIGRAHEDDAQGHARCQVGRGGGRRPAQSSPRACLANFLITTSRFSLEIWSMKSMPLRWSISCCRQVARRPSASISLLGAVAVGIARRARGRAARPPRNSPGSRGSPPRRRCAPPRSRRTSGLIRASGCFSSSSLARGRWSTRRCGTPIWIAARPMPGRVVHGLEHVVDQRRSSRVGLAPRARRRAAAWSRA